MSEVAQIRPVPALFDPQTPAETVTTATAYATVLAQGIEKRKLYTTIGSSKHVRVEGWQLLATMLGLRPNVVWTKPLENGWEARVEVCDREGEIRGSGEAMCTRDEKTWKNRDEYAIRSMA